MQDRTRGSCHHYQVELIDLEDTIFEKRISPHPQHRSCDSHETITTTTSPADT